MIRISPCSVEYAGLSRQHLYNSIIGREALNDLKAVLDFKDTIEINSVILPTQSLSCYECIQGISRAREY